MKLLFMQITHKYCTLDVIFKNVFPFSNQNPIYSISMALLRTWKSLLRYFSFFQLPVSLSLSIISNPIRLFLKICDEVFNKFDQTKVNGYKLLWSVLYEIFILYLISYWYDDESYLVQYYQFFKDKRHR